MDFAKSPVIRLCIVGVVFALGAGHRNAFAQMAIPEVGDRQIQVTIEQAHRMGPLIGKISVSAVDPAQSMTPWPEPYLIIIEFGAGTQYLYPSNAIFPGATLTWGRSIGFGRFEQLHIQQRQRERLPDELRVRAVFGDGARVSLATQIQYAPEASPDWAVARDQDVTQGLADLEAALNAAAADPGRLYQVVQAASRVLEWTNDPAIVTSVWRRARDAITGAANETALLNTLQTGQMMGAWRRMDTGLYRTLVTERERLGIEVSAHQYLTLMQMLVLHGNDVAAARSYWPLFKQAVERMPPAEQSRFHFDDAITQALLLPEVAIDPARLHSLPPISSTPEYRAFRGLDDAVTAPMDWQRALVGWGVDFARRVLEHPGVNNNAQFPGEGIFDAHLANWQGPARQLIGQSIHPDDLADSNLYRKATFAAETEIKMKIAAATGAPLTPADLIVFGLEATGGSYPMAVLAIHNLLKSITWRGRHDAIQRAEENFESPTYRHIFPQSVQLLADANLITGKLVSLRQRPADTADKMGPWYHIFAVLASGALLVPEQSLAAVAVEHGMKKLGSFRGEGGYNQEKATIDGVFAAVQTTLLRDLCRNRTMAAMALGYREQEGVPAADASPELARWVTESSDERQTIAASEPARELMSASASIDASLAEIGFFEQAAQARSGADAASMRTSIREETDRIVASPLLFSALARELGIAELAPPAEVWQAAPPPATGISATGREAAGAPNAAATSVSTSADGETPDAAASAASAATAAPAAADTSTATGAPTATNAPIASDAPASPDSGRLPLMVIVLVALGLLAVIAYMGRGISPARRADSAR